MTCMPSSLRILVDRRPTNLRVRGEGAGGYFADVVMCVEEESGYVLGAEMVHPGQDEGVVVAMAQQAMEAAHERAPQVRVIWVARHERVARALAEEFGGQVILETGGTFGSWDEAYLAMDRDLAGHGTMLGYLWRQDITAAEVGELFEEAAEYYRLRPWQFLADSELLEKASPVPGERPLLISVMGASGISRGLALFDTKEHFEAMMSDRAHDGVVYASFERRDRMPHTVVVEVEEQGWRVASRSAFPMVVRVREERPVPCSGDDLRRVTAALRALNEVTRAYRESVRSRRRR